MMKKKRKRFNPSRRFPLRLPPKIVIDMEIKDEIGARTISQRERKIHVIFKIKNSKWKDFHVYFSSFQFSDRQLDDILNEFINARKFFKERE